MNLGGKNLFSNFIQASSTLTEEMNNKMRDRSGHLSIIFKYSKLQQLSPAVRWEEHFHCVYLSEATLSATREFLIF